MDIFISFLLALISLIVYPFVFILQKIEDGGPTFIIQERIGRNNQISKIIKFRTMSFNDNGNYDNPDAKANHVTKVGHFLRKTRIDELPQLWNVLRGDLSLIGPRPELVDLVKNG
jgi:lipopolysaccharide/colanic/teichoic acid biosynthesis glycosyltransferase